MIVYRCYHLKLVSVTQTLIVNYMYNVTLFEIHALNSLIVVFFLDHLQNLFISVPSLYKRSNLDIIENTALFLKAKSMKNLESKEQDIDGWLLVLCYFKETQINLDPKRQEKYYSKVQLSAFQNIFHR